MTGCSAPNCSNHSKNGFKFYRFPADCERRKQWLINCKRQNWIPTQNDRLCSKHFEDNQLEQNRADGKKRLLPFAVPTIFNAPNLTTFLYTSRKRLYKRHVSKYFNKCDVIPFNSEISSFTVRPKSIIKQDESLSKFEDNTSACNEISDKTLKCELGENLRDRNSFSIFRPTIMKEIMQCEESINVPQQGRINVPLLVPIIKQEIKYFPEPSMSTKHPLDINKSSMPGPNIKQEIIESEEFTNVLQKDNIIMPVPMPIIKQKIKYMPERSASPEHSLEPICFVSTTESIAEEVFENIPRGDDQHDIFGKFVASELRCIESVNLQKEIKLMIVKILIEKTK